MHEWYVFLFLQKVVEFGICKIIWKLIAILILIIEKLFYVVDFDFFRFEGYVYSYIPTAGFILFRFNLKLLEGECFYFSYKIEFLWYLFPEFPRISKYDL